MMRNADAANPGSRTVILALGLLAALGLACFALSLGDPSNLAQMLATLVRPTWRAVTTSGLAFRLGKAPQILRIAGITLVAPALGWLIARRLSLVLGAVSRRRALFAGAAGVALVVTLVVVFGNHHLGGVDEVLAVELGWRQHQGQAPYRDFVCLVPVGFYLVPRIAFGVLGVAWSSLTWATAIAAGITFAWTYALALELGAAVGVALVLASQLLGATYLFAAFWWYNPITIGAAAVYVLSALALVRTPASRRTIASFALATAVLAMHKPNVAALVLVPTTIALLLNARTRRPATIAVLAAVALDGAVLGAARVSPIDVVTSYLSIARRARPSVAAMAHPMLFDTLLVASWTAFVLFAVAAFVRDRGSGPADASRADRRTAAIIAASLVLAGTYSAIVHGETKIVETPCFVLPLALVALGIGGLSRRREHAARAVLGVAVSLTVIGVWLGAERLRIATIGYGAFFEWDTAPGAADPGFFRSMRGGPRLKRTLAQLRELRAEFRDAKTFYGPRIEFAYAALGVTSPTGMPPLLWHADTFHPLALQDELVARFDAHHFDVAVFAREDIGNAPRAFKRLFTKQYVISRVLQDRYPDLSVFLRRELAETLYPGGGG